MNKSKQVIFIFVSIVIGCVVAVLIAEIFLRIFFKQPLYAFEKGLFSSSEEYGYYLTPSVEKSHAQPEYAYKIKSNAYGFRGKEPNLNAGFRILVLGDSVAMGQGVGEGRNLTDLAQEYFKDQEKDVNIFNAAISGYSTINYRLVLKKLAPKYRPDLVICMFYWNDIGMKESLKVQNGYIVLSLSTKWQAALREWLNNHSRLYCYMKRIFYNLRHGNEAQQRGQDASFKEEDLITAMDHFREMKDISERMNAEFVVTFLPLGGINEGGEALQKSKRFLIEEMKNAGIPYVDWMKIDSTKNKEDFIFPIDHHWNDKGHIYFSHKLSRFIEHYLN